MKPSNESDFKPSRAAGPASALILSLSFLSVPVQGSSHSDAPLIKQDPQANLTDVYAFVGQRYRPGPGAAENVLNVIVSVRPFSDPGDGPIYDRFADDARYSIHITDPNTGRETLRYDFNFSKVNPLRPPGLKNPDTFLSYGRGTEIGPIENIGDARQNYTQTYSVSTDSGTRGARNDRRGRTLLARGLVVAPPNVGNNTTPAYNDEEGNAVSGAASFAALDRYTRQAIHDVGTRGEAVFAGHRDDGFFADTPGIFDLLNARIIDNNGNNSDGLGQDGGGVDGFKGYNVLTYAIQIPLSELRTTTYTAPFADLANGIAGGGAAINTGVGVYASVSRPRVTLRHPERDPVSRGQWVQVNRLGNPLFNEVLVPYRDKDIYNRTKPPGDDAFRRYATRPELPVLINAVFGTDFATTGRADLALVFIPDVLRVDTTTPPVTLPGQTGFSRFGFVGGDTTTNSAGRVISSGWPNGRRIGDDVVDIALTAVASGPSYETITVLGDNVAANDALYHQVFPYLATPHAGTTTNQRQAPGNDDGIERQ